MSHPFQTNAGSGAKVLAGLLSLAICGCRPGPRPEPAPTEPNSTRTNLVVVVVDALRSDRLGCYGHDRDTSPFIDELAAGGALFENMDAQSPWTAPAMASIWTSRYPAELGVGALPGADGVRMVDKYSASALSTTPPTLAEVLHAQGYLTIAAIANTWASDHVGLLRGFSVWSRAGGRAEAVLGKALGVIQENTRKNPPETRPPFFAYLHLIDVHEPTAPPQPYLQLFPALDGLPHERPHARWQFGDDRSLDSEEAQAFRSHKEGLYDGAIAYVDAQLRSFMDQLERLGVADDTIVVITSDHGEELWDSPDFALKFLHHPKRQGGVGHGHSMLREVLDVPLILHGPGVPPARVPQQVSHLDIAPTVLGLLGLPPADGMLGIDLMESLRADELVDRPVLSEDMAYGYDAKSYQAEGYKYILYVGHPEQPAFLFDLGRDPEEKHNRVDEEPDRAADYDHRLRELMAEHPPTRGRVAVVSPQEIERLRSLGYL